MINWTVKIITLKMQLFSGDSCNIMHNQSLALNPTNQMVYVLICLWLKILKILRMIILLNIFKIMHVCWVWYIMIGALFRKTQELMIIGRRNGWMEDWKTKVMGCRWLRNKLEKWSMRYRRSLKIPIKAMMNYIQAVLNDKNYY